MLNTLKLRHVVGFILFLFFHHQAGAQSYILDGNYFVRSSTDFLLPGNKIGVLQNGSIYRVVSRTPKANGEALEIEVTAMAHGSYINESPTGHYYLYKPNSSNPIPRDGAGTVCATCGGQAQSPGTATAALTDVADKVYEIANTAPKATDPPNETVRSLEGPRQQGKLDKEIKNYSNSPEVKRMIDWAMKNKSASSHGICYRKVKEAMATQCGPPRKNYVCKNAFSPEGGKKGPGKNLTPSVSTEMADSYALSAKTRLKKEGFVNLLEVEPYKSELRSASEAPKGAILVYSSGIPCSGHPDCGHAEIKVGGPGEPGYVSDYYSADAVNETPRAKKYGSTYKLVGIMIKPKE